MPMTVFRRVAFAASLAAAPAAAQPAPAPVQLTYALYVSGLKMAGVKADFTLQPQAYQVQLSYQLSGTFGALFTGGGSSRVDGRFASDTAQPRELFSSGHLWGKPRVTQIDWQNDRPVMTQMEPPLEPDREPVPAAQQVRTIDTLSSMAVLLRRLWATGRCETDARTFDGRLLSRIEVRTVGEEALDKTSRSSFSGPALRCDIERVQLAGFTRDADEAELHRPHHATVWFARIVPGGPLVPVRIGIESHGIGATTVYITG